MPTDRDFVSVVAQAQRAVEQQGNAQMREESEFASAADEAQRDRERATQAQRATRSAQAARAFIAEQRHRAAVFAESRAAQIAQQNEQLEQQIVRLQSLLCDTIGSDPHIDLETLKHRPAIPTFDPGHEHVEPLPDLEEYLPPEPSGLQMFLPGAKKRYAEDLARAHERHRAAVTARAQRMEASQAWLRARRAAYEQELAQIHAQTAAQHAEIDVFRRDLANGAPEAVVSYSLLVLEASKYPDGFPQRAEIAYVPESQQLVVEYDLPPLAVVPEVASYKYAKAKDEVSTAVRPLSQRKALYDSVVAQVTLRTLHELFEADRAGHVQVIVFNGHVDTIDPATGRPARPCLVSVCATRDLFDQLDLSKVDATACLKMLNATTSKGATAVAPVPESGLVDPRFIDKADVLSGLDRRPNLIDLTPSEFEALIANLFQTMGLETRLIQSSRDGGVNCVAHDPRPILGGKVMIQAKRHHHTVGVSAVTDLFGTVQNEGASKGILVTTGSYAKEAFDFARGKPLELLSGSNLLELLAEYTGLEAKIEMPEHRQGPQADVRGH